MAEPVGGDALLRGGTCLVSVQLLITYWRELTKASKRHQVRIVEIAGSRFAGRSVIIV